MKPKQATLVRALADTLFNRSTDQDPCTQHPLASARVDRFREPFSGAGRKQCQALQTTIDNTLHRMEHAVVVALTNLHPKRQFELAALELIEQAFQGKSNNNRLRNSTLARDDV